MQLWIAQNLEPTAARCGAGGASGSVARAGAVAFHHASPYKTSVRTRDFDFVLPEELIAQHPAPRRDQSRLLVLRRATGQLDHRRFRDLPAYLRPGDVLVLNDSKVVPARLRGVNLRTGGQFDLLLLEQNTANDWWVLLRPGRRARPGTRIALRDRHHKPTGVEAEVLEVNPEGHRRLRFYGTPDLLRDLQRLGEMPLPPYIKRPRGATVEEDFERYQTVYARCEGSVAAPTAGLHFTPRLLTQLRAQGVAIGYVTLHVGLGTFAPVKTESLARHVMHAERFELSEQTVACIERARAAGGRIVAVGTTTVRVLESVARAHAGRLEPGLGRTRLFIYPPWQFQIVNALVTNFHLPRSTLLMLVSAFAAPGETRGREVILAAYREAIQRRYRFFSYGDAMLIL